MIVRVLFFAHLRERLGVREIEVELPAPASVEDLRRELCRRYPSFDGEYLRFAVNQAYVATGHPLHDQDEVALIPPVSGGASQAPCLALTHHARFATAARLGGASAARSASSRSGTSR